MAKKILMEELHIEVFAPRGLPELDYDAIHRTLNLARFRRQLREAIKVVVHRYAALGKIRIAVSL